MPRTLLWVAACAGLLSGSGFAADRIEGLARTCNSCHGVKGVSVGPNMPSIGGLPEAYLRNTMLQWKRGERYGTAMDRLLKGYSDEDIAALAKYFAALPWVPVAQPAEEQHVKDAKFILRACGKCHGETGGTPEDAVTPKLNGQWRQYLELEIVKYRDPTLKMPHAKMQGNAERLDKDEIDAITHYFSSQK